MPGEQDIEQALVALAFAVRRETRTPEPVAVALGSVAYRALLRQMAEKDVALLGVAVDRSTEREGVIYLGAHPSPVYVRLATEPTKGGPTDG